MEMSNSESESNEDYDENKSDACFEQSAGNG